MQNPNPDPGEEYEHVNTSLFGIVEPISNQFKDASDMTAPYNAPPSGTPATMNGFVWDYCNNFVQITQRNPAFEESVFDLIHTHAGGVPRRINTLCTRALLATFLAEKHVVTKEDVQHVITEFSEEFGEEIAGDAPPTEPAPSFGLMDLEKRVHGVERAMNLTVNLLRQLIRRQGETRTTPPG
jgi:hypothetical protein